MKWKGREGMGGKEKGKKGKGVDRKRRGNGEVTPSLKHGYAPE